MRGKKKMWVRTRSLRGQNRKDNRVTARCAQLSSRGEPMHVKKSKAGGNLVGEKGPEASSVCGERCRNHHNMLALKATAAKTFSRT